MAEPLRLRLFEPEAPRLRLLEPEGQTRESWRVELARLHQLDRECFPPGIAYGRTELERLVRHPSAWTALAESGSQLLGFIVVRTWRGGLHLLTIDVALSARRRGVGRLLMDWAEERARALRLGTMRLEVAVNNGEARAFYLHLGFREVERIPDYYPPGIDALVLERQLPLSA